MIILWPLDLVTPGVLEAELERHWQGDFMVALVKDDRSEAHLYTADETLPPYDHDADEWCSMAGSPRVLAARLRGLIHNW